MTMYDMKLCSLIWQLRSSYSPWEDWLWMPVLSCENCHARVIRVENVCIYMRLSYNKRHEMSVKRWLYSFDSFPPARSSCSPPSAPTLRNTCIGNCIAEMTGAPTENFTLCLDDRSESGILYGLYVLFTSSKVVRLSWMSLIPNWA